MKNVDAELAILHFWRSKVNCHCIGIINF